MLTDSRPHFHSLIFHVHQHRQFSCHFFIQLIMALPLVNGFGLFLFVHHQQGFHGRLFVLVALQAEAIRAEATRAPFLPSWTRSHPTRACRHALGHGQST